MIRSIRKSTASAEITEVDSIEKLQAESRDGYAVGIDASNGTPEIIMVSSGIDSTDRYRAVYANFCCPPNCILRQR